MIDNFSNKKSISEYDFQLLIDAEKIAYHVFRLFEKEKDTREYVDIIAMSFCDYDVISDLEIPIMHRAKMVLKKDYDTDMMSYPFKYENIKLKIQRYGLLKDLENYFINKNIKYDSDKVFFKGQELSSSDPNVEYFMDQINDIDLDLINLDNKNINI